MSAEVVAASNEIAAWIEVSVRGIEALSVIIIVIAIAYGTYVYIRRKMGHPGTQDPLEEFKEHIGKRCC